MKKEKEKKRNYVYDLLRVISCICIILIHTTGFLYNYKKDSILWWSGDIIQAIVRIALPIFVVLSGALVLDTKDESNTYFYYKRFSKILIPFFIYNMLYLVFNIYYVIGKFEINKIFLYMYMIIKGSIYEHLWFVYMILGLYLCTPFIKVMCQHLSQTELKNLFILLTFIMIITTLLPSFNITIGITNITFSGWIIYYLMGYILKNSNMLNEKRKTFYILGIVSFIITIIETRYHLLNLQGLYDLSITMYFQVIAVFLFFNNLRVNINNKKLQFLSNYSFEVYIVHGAIMNSIERINNKFGLLNSNSFLFNIIFIIMTIILSFISSYIVHNILVIPCTKLIDKIILFFKNRWKKRMNYEKV